MKKNIILLLLLAIAGVSKAQVLLNMQIPYTGVYLKSQLWNFSIVNPGSQSLTLKIEMTFSDVTNGQLIFTASSNTFTVNQQVTMMQASDLTPIIYNVVSANYNIDANPNGFLPVGAFQVCFAVVKIGGESSEILAEQCEQVEVEPISPPILIQPGDAEVSDNVRPFFTWLPPSPASNFNNLNYDYFLVEVQDNQIPADAIDQNIAVYSEHNVPANSLLYPSSLPELDSSKLYAWQVTANSSNNAASKSEIWTFKIRLYGLDTLHANTDAFYTPVRKTDDASYVTSTGMVRFEYLNELNDSIVKINFYELGNSVRLLINTDPINVRVRFGQNFLQSDFGSLSGARDRHLYQLELINKKQEKWYLKFEYRTPVNEN